MNDQMLAADRARRQQVRERRLDFLRQHVDVARQRGLEIGPLDSPVVTPDVGSICYADHAASEDLRVKYADASSVDKDEIVAVDFLWGQVTLAQAAAAQAPFDYVVAAHVIEHVPDLIGWLREVAEVLTPGGRLCLVIPDRRLTFDVRRRPSDLAEVVEAHLLRLRRPSVRAVFDYVSRSIQVDTGALWRGEQAYPDGASYDYAQAWDAAARAAHTEDYIDTHCWVFSDAEFVRLMGDLIKLSSLDFRFVGFTASPVGEFEFFVALEVLDRQLTADEKLAVALESLPPAAAMATVPLPPTTPLSQAPPLFVNQETVGAEYLSKLELVLIKTKRGAMAKARTAVRRLREMTAR